MSPVMFEVYIWSFIYLLSKKSMNTYIPILKGVRQNTTPWKKSCLHTGEYFQSVQIHQQLERQHF